MKKVFLLLLLFSGVLLFFCTCSDHRNNGPVKVLILSGRNNHEWQKTTPVLVRIYNQSGIFDVSVTNSPDTLTYQDMEAFDVIVSNWNTWPDNDLRLPESWEKDFMEYVKKGGGTIFIHAGASSFYGWDDYHNIGIGRWGKETTHGEQTRGRVTGFNQEHPVTKGFHDFLITDEFWEKTDIVRGAVPLASIVATNSSDGHAINEYAVFVKETGKNRSFFTTLGHNERAMLNSGFGALLLRATQWVAKRDVTIEPPPEITDSSYPALTDLRWIETDTTLALENYGSVIWQFNFNNRFGRPYFHPLCSKKSILTCVSPPDHPWHLGFWFCWKYINEVNYWEYLDNFKSEDTGYRSTGITDIKKMTVTRNPDFSAEIKLDISYHEPDSDPVLTEKREILVSRPFNDGSYFIDQESLFAPVAGNVVLDRTPVQKEPGGRSWGGYAGLSVRFSQDYSSAVIIAPDTVDNYRKNPWVYLGFTTLTGDNAGMCIFQDLRHTTPYTSWYIINTPEIPFFYYSPAVLYDGKIILETGTMLDLRYRTWIVPGRPDQASLQTKYDEFTGTNQ
jgi:type 1 glutamine amidotransferase